jgi:hypothetical protein
VAVLSLRNLCIAILLTLPFTKSLTAPVGFPLKIYEPLVVIALAAAVTEGRIEVGSNNRFLRYWLVFLFLSLFPSAWGYLLVREQNLSYLEWAVGRYEPLTNVIFHTVYLALDITALTVFLVCLQRGTLSLREFARIWTWGALVAVAYAVVLNLVYFAGLPQAYALRFADVQTSSIRGIEFVRSGPFEEGNFFGLYMLLSLGLALWSGSRYPAERLFHRAVPALGFGIFVSASPAAMAFMVVLLVAASLGKGVPKPVRALELTVAGALLVVVLTTDLLQELVLGKFSLLLYGGVTDSGNVSLVRRFNEMYHGWRLFLDHPWGVGIGNFGYFWGNYPEYYPWLTVGFMFKKQIPNNVYLEVLTEQGIQGLVVFVALLVSLVMPLVRRREAFLLLVVACTAAYFVVFPTFRLVFLWVFWAFLLHVGSGERQPAPWSVNLHG